jgi:hypothetical protein
MIGTAAEPRDPCRKFPRLPGMQREKVPRDAPRTIRRLYHGGRSVMADLPQ